MKKILQLLISTLLVFATMQLFAARITAVKGRKVVIKLDGMQAGRGDIFNVYNKKKKWKALIKITRVKGSKAYGIRKGKGRIRKGYTLKVKKRGKSSRRRRSNTGEKMAAGLLVGPAAFTMSVSTTAANRELKGSSNILVKGFLDYNVFDFLDARFGLGMVTLKAEDTCINCEVSIGYLIIDATPRFIFNKKSSFKTWVGGHFGLYVPTSKEVTAITEDSVATTNFFGVSFGFDYIFGGQNQFMVPFEIDYGIFPPSDVVSANAMIVSVGFGYRF